MQLKNKEKQGNLNIPLYTKEIKFQSKIYTTKILPGSDNFIYEFYQKKKNLSEIIVIFHKIAQKNKRGNHDKTVCID